MSNEEKVESKTQPKHKITFKTPLIVAAISGIALVLAAFISPFATELANKLTTPTSIPKEIRNLNAYSILKRMRDCVIVINPTNKIIYVNERTKEIFNIRDENFANKNLEISEIFIRKNSKINLNENQLSKLLTIINSKPRNETIVFHIDGSAWRWDINAIEKNLKTEVFVIIGIEFIKEEE